MEHPVIKLESSIERIDSRLKLITYLVKSFTLSDFEQLEHLQRQLALLNCLNERMDYLNIFFSDLTGADVVDEVAECRDILDNIRINLYQFTREIRDRKVDKYIAKTRHCSRLYIHINTKIEQIVRILQDPTTKNSVGILDPYVMLRQQQIRRYENQLFHLDDRYRWLYRYKTGHPRLATETYCLDMLRKHHDKVMEDLTTANMKRLLRIA